MGRISPCLCSLPLPALLPHRAEHLTPLFDILLNLPPFWSQYGLCLSRLHDLPHLSLLVWEDSWQQGSLPTLTALHSGFELPCWCENLLDLGTSCG